MDPGWRRVRVFFLFFFVLFFCFVFFVFLFFYLSVNLWCPECGLTLDVANCIATVVVSLSAVKLQP